jgi:AAA15 family ATPase/GTPase
MYKLISFEVENFTSFSKNQSINFEDDITAVYGPNGAGKSNLFNAINSVKTLVQDQFSVLNPFHFLIFLFHFLNS